MRKKKLTRQQYKRNLRFRLWIKNPHCYWCGKKTILPPPGRIRNHSQYPDNETSIEHLNNRLDENRKSPNNTYEQRIVIACRECNWVRGKEREIGYIEFQQFCGAL